MKRYSKPYQYNILDSGGSMYDVGEDLVNQEVRNKYHKEDVKRTLSRLYQLVEQYMGRDRDGISSRMFEDPVKSGDLDSAPLDPLNTGQFPYPLTKGENSLHNDIINGPREVREYKSSGGIHGDPFPYTANNNRRQSLSRLSLERPEEVRVVEEVKRVQEEKKIPPIEPDQPITKAQVKMKLHELQKKWNTSIRVEPLVDIRLKLALLLKDMLHEICYLKVKTRFPEHEIVKFTYSWIRDTPIMMMALKDTDPEMWTRDSFRNLVSGLSTLYYDLRERDESGSAIPSKPTNYNNGFF